MKLIKMTEHIYYSESDPVKDRPVLGYIRGSRQSVMIDAGNSKEHYLEYRKLLEQETLRIPDICVITHWHWDHTFGLHGLEMKSYAHYKTNEKLKELSSWKWNDAAMKKRLETGEEIPFADEHMRAEYEDITEIKVVQASANIVDEMTFDCGDIHCQCIHLPSAHSDDSIVIYIPEEKILFIGDIYGDNFYQNHSRDKQKTKELHDALEKLDFTYAIPGHSNPLEKQRLLQFLETFLNAKPSLGKE